MVTFNDIAKKVGVSAATVSRIVNNTDHPINPETRQKVLNALREEQYSRNVFEHILSGQCYTLELFLGYPFLCDQGFPYILATTMDGIKGVFRQRNCQVFLDVTDNLDEAMRKAAMLQGMPSAGAMLIASSADGPLVDYLSRNDIPFVILGTREFSHCNFIDTDHIGVGRKAVQYLADLGRRKIACITGPPEVLPCVEILLGFNAAIKELDLPSRPEWVKRAESSSVESGRSLMDEMLQGPYPPDAIIVYTDFLAVGAINAIEEAGLSVPDDIAIVGYDDFPIATSVRPHLTTFHHPIQEMTNKAVNWLLDRLIPRNHSSQLLQDLVLPELIVRESCGASHSSGRRRRRRIVKNGAAS